MSHTPLKSSLCQKLRFTPDLLALAHHFPARYPVLLESLGHTHSTEEGDWDLLLIADPRFDAIVSSGTDVQTGAQPFFARLRALQQSLSPLDANAAGVPFVGGIFVYLGFEAAAEIEPRLKLKAPAFDFPKALALRCVGAIAIERTREEAYFIIEPEAQDLIEAIGIDLDQDLDALGAQAIALTLEEDAPEHFLQGVSRVQDYLHAGDVFQVNLSRGYQARLPQPALHTQIYANLRAANPSPFAGLMQWRNYAVISSSPERLVSVQDDLVQTRPIAGTKARHADELDLTLEEKSQFVGDIKERAEHIMLIDLERNDLGRVCQAGSVEVNELLTVESYAHVHHLVSNVRGILRPGVDAVDVLKAVFPGGTITGCPKVRCMEIISELEGVGRGPYTGSMGYISRDGRMDFNILIRTFAKVDGANDSNLYFRAGAGIVVDSVAEKELAETRAKAKGLLRALFVNEQSKP
jgi:anthranilate synthase component I